jgi:hypothetical protein
MMEKEVKCKGALVVATTLNSDLRDIVCPSFPGLPVPTNLGSGFP